MQETGEHILSLVCPKYSSRRPQARLWRLFAALLPADFHCVFNYEAHRNVSELLIPEGHGPSHVLIRARLREALGLEATLADHVKRAVFCWWLHEQHKAILQGKVETPLPALPPQELKPLTLWQYHKQFKGNFAIYRTVDAYRDVIRLCQHGMPRQELVAAIGAEAEFKSLALNSRQQLVSRIQGMGLLELRDGLIFPTKDGLALLETDVADSLVERMLERVFPLAHLLRFVKNTPTPTGELFRMMQELYPNWTETMAPSAMLKWASSLDLVEKDKNDRWRLSSYGVAWEKRLPRELPHSSQGAETEAGTSENFDDEVKKSSGVGRVTSGSFPRPTLAMMRERFSSDPEASRFVLESRQLSSLHYAWHCNPRKRFVILSGLSGTGKTALLSHYARLYCQGLPSPSLHVAVVPVSPDWRDPTGLLGYFNALHEDPTFQIEPALRLLMRAADNPAMPYFLILDEMNLARVEQYFAPLLSAMETGADLVLHGQREPVNDVPPTIRWPTNLFIGGTVNMDETTHPFSDKVLDRAFTLEFWDADLARFFQTRKEPRQEDFEQALQRIYDALKPIRRHFGYRTAQEVLAFVSAAGPEASAEEKSVLLDQGVFSKILPRLRGEEHPELRKTFEALKSVCKERGLTFSGEKLARMESVLQYAGTTGFWS